MKRVWIDIPLTNDLDSKCVPAHGYIVNHLFVVYNAGKVSPTVDKSFHWHGWSIFHVPTRRNALCNLGYQREAVCQALRISQMKCIEWENSDIEGYWAHLRLPARASLTWVQDVATGKITAEECDRQIMQLMMEEDYEP